MQPDWCWQLLSPPVDAVIPVSFDGDLTSRTHNDKGAWPLRLPSHQSWLLPGVANTSAPNKVLKNGRCWLLRLNPSKWDQHTSDWRKSNLFETSIPSTGTAFGVYEGICPLTMKGGVASSTYCSSGVQTSSCKVHPLQWSTSQSCPFPLGNEGRWCGSVWWRCHLSRSKGFSRNSWQGQLKYERFSGSISVSSFSFWKSAVELYAPKLWEIEVVYISMV